jgi:predicted transcriptional regulator
MSQIAKGARVTGDARDALTQSLRARYESGESIRSIAESTGRSYGFVHRLLSESGTSLRSRGGATRGKRSA